MQARSRDCRESTGRLRVSVHFVSTGELYHLIVTCLTRCKLRDLAGSIVPESSRTRLLAAKVHLRAQSMPQFGCLQSRALHHRHIANYAELRVGGIENGEIKKGSEVDCAYERRSV